MKCGRVFIATVLTCLCSVGSAAAETPVTEAPAVQTPARKPLVFKIPDAPGNGPKSVEAAVPFGPALPIAALAFSPDGKLLAVGGYQEVLLWDLEGARLARRVGVGQLQDMVHAVAFADDGKTLLTGDGAAGQSGGVKFFKSESGEFIAALDAPPSVVQCLAVSADGKLLAAGSDDGKVRVWNLADRTLAQTLAAHQGWALGAAFSPEGKYLATTGADKTLKLWQTDKWELALQYDLPAAVHGAAFDGAGQTLVAGVGGTAEWALRIGRIDQDIEQISRRKPNPRVLSTGTGMPLCVAWPPKSEHVYVACSDNTVRAYHPKSTRFVTTYSGHRDCVYAVAVAPDGVRLASGSADGTVKLWRGADGSPSATLVQLAPGSDDWLILTRDGHFTASAPDKVAWKAKGADAKQLTERYHNAELVQKALATAVASPEKKEGPTKP